MSIPVPAFADALGSSKGKLCPAQMDEQQKGFVKGGQKDWSCMLLGFELELRMFYLEGLQLSNQDRAA